MKKGSIKEQLNEALTNKVVVVGEETATANTKKKKPKFKSTIGRDFIETAYWNILNADENVVDEPEKPTFKVPCAPTIGECGGTFVPVKHNFYNHTFDVPVFKFLHKIPQRFANGRVKNNKDETFMRK